MTRALFHRWAGDFFQGCTFGRSFNVVVLLNAPTSLLANPTQCQTADSMSHRIYVPTDPSP